MTKVEKYNKQIELAVLLRAIGHFGWDDMIYGHASFRTGKNSYLVNNFDLLYEEQTASQLIEINMKEDLPEGQNLAGYTIHNAIYKARPDVNCIIHTHTKEGIAVSSDVAGLWPASQAAMLSAGSLSMYDYHGIVDTVETTKKLVEVLGTNYYMLMRNHGLLVVGNRPAAAFNRMQRLQTACEVQVLMDRKRTVDIDENVIFDQIEKSRAVDWERPNTDGLWEAITRKMKRLYPELVT